MTNHMLRKVQDRITDPFPKINSVVIEVSEWLSNFIHYLQ